MEKEQLIDSITASSSVTRKALRVWLWLMILLAAMCIVATSCTKSVPKPQCTSFSGNPIACPIDSTGR